MRRALALLASAVVAAPAFAADWVTYPVDQSFDDAAFAVENAIIAKGLVIDNVSHVGDMLARTGADVGSDVVLFEKADVFTFCSAAVSRAVMEADPTNIAFCPYGIYVYSMPGEEGKSYVGHRTYPEGAMKQVEALLGDIVEEAVGE